MRRFQVVQILWDTPSWSAAEKEIERFTVWSGQGYVVPNLHELRTTSAIMPERPSRRHLFSFFDRRRYTYVLEEMVDGGAWGPPESDQERFQRGRKTVDILF